MILSEPKLPIFSGHNTNCRDLTLCIKEEALKFEDSSVQRIKKEESSDYDIPDNMNLDFAKQAEKQSHELILSLERYLETFVSVEDFDIDCNSLGDMETQELIFEAKKQFKEWGIAIIHSLGEDIKKKGLQHILPKSYLVNFTEKTKRRIFNSYKQLKKNLTETLASSTNYVNNNNKEINMKPQKKKIYKRKSDFPDRARTLLKTWFIAHANDPYPSHEEKISLAREGGISMKQLENWLTNTRGRIWKKMQKETKFGTEIEKTLLLQQEEFF